MAERHRRRQYPRPRFLERERDRHRRVGRAVEEIPVRPLRALGRDAESERLSDEEGEVRLVARLVSEVGADTAARLTAVLRIVQ
jgi:hypothetical protein